MAVIVPSALASAIQDYNRIVDQLSFAPRLHIDIMDGLFAKPASINLVQAHWPEEAHADVHMMVDDPAVHIETLIAIKPHLVILHAESQSFAEAFEELTNFKINIGIALLPETRPDDVPELVEAAHCLIFGGKLGSYGGRADLSQLSKVDMVRDMNPDIEVGWDGGANKDNIPELVAAGIDVVNVGGAIQNADDALAAYQELMTLTVSE